MKQLRADLEPLPDRLKALPVHRSYPVPWFVAWINGEPERVEWYALGKPATREQVEVSVTSGLPALEGLARMQDDLQGTGALEDLHQRAAAFEKLYPVALLEAVS